jgi:hypothetical protein
MLDKDTWEIASFIVTVISLPVTIATFVYQARRERTKSDTGHRGSSAAWHPMPHNDSAQPALSAIGLKRDELGRNFHSCVKVHFSPCAFWSNRTMSR